MVGWSLAVWRRLRLQPIGCTPAVCNMNSAAAAAVCGLWRYISVICLAFALLTLKLTSALQYCTIALNGIACLLSAVSMRLHLYSKCWLSCEKLNIWTPFSGVVVSLHKILTYKKTFWEEFGTEATHSTQYLSWNRYRNFNCIPIILFREAELHLINSITSETGCLGCFIKLYLKKKRIIYNYVVCCDWWTSRSVSTLFSLGRSSEEDEFYSGEKI